MITDTSNEIIQTIDNGIKPYIKMDNIKYSDKLHKNFKQLNGGISSPLIDTKVIVVGLFKIVSLRLLTPSNSLRFCLAIVSPALSR